MCTIFTILATRYLVKINRRATKYESLALQQCLKLVSWDFLKHENSISKNKETLVFQNLFNLLRFIGKFWIHLLSSKNQVFTFWTNRYLTYLFGNWKENKLTSYFGTRFLLEYLINLVWLLAPFDLVRLGIFVFRNFSLMFVVDDL